MLSHVGVFEDKLSCLGRTSRQDPVGSYMVLYFVGSYTGSWQDYIIERGDRILSRSKSGRILYQGGKVGRILHRILSKRKVGRIPHYNFIEMNFL